MTPLLRASEAGHFEAVRMLLSAKADLGAHDRDGLMAYELAQDFVYHGGQSEALNLLSQNGEGR